MEQWLKDEICNYLNNIEDEEYCKLSDEQIDEIAENIYDKVLLDDEWNNALNSAIEWYANHYIAEHFNMVYFVPNKESKKE